MNDGLGGDGLVAELPKHFRLPCRPKAGMEESMTALSIKTVWWWGC
jgi:hypothetical protein